MKAARFSSNGANAMSAFGGKSLGSTSTLLPASEAKSRMTRDRRSRPAVERLERLLLLSTGCPVISGFVYLDENQRAALTNNGHLDPGELPIPNAQVQLFDSQNRLIATTRSDINGAYEFDGVPNPNAQPVTFPPQTINLNPTLTNFVNAPFNPANIQLFDPELGTLTGITISTTTSFQSVVTTQNLSQSSSANITLALNGNYVINGLSQAIAGAASATQGPISDGPFDPANPDANKLPPVTLTAGDSPPSRTLTSPADLAFFIARPGRTSIRPTMTANGFGTAMSDAGGLATTNVTSVSGANLTITFTYIPKICFAPGVYRLVQTPNPPNVTNGKTSQPGVVFPAPPAGQPQTILVNVGVLDKPDNDFAKLISTPCPTPGKVIRFGVHHQATQLVLTFVGTVDPTLANNPANYTVITKTGVRIPIVSATFDPATNSVTLIPARRLNIHQRFDLSVNLPCTGPCNNVVIPFGGRASLGGFVNHQGRFVRFVNGHRINA